MQTFIAGGIEFNNMKKEIFKGKILTEFIWLVKFTLIFTAIIFILCALLILGIAVFYEKVDHLARIVLYVFAFLSLVAGIGYPLVTLHLIRIYPQKRKITKHFLKEYVFREYKGDIE